MARFSFPLAVACALAALSALADSRAQAAESRLIYELLEQRQSRDPAERDSIDRPPERPTLPDRPLPDHISPDRARVPILRPGAPDPTAPGSPLLGPDRHRQEQGIFQDRLDRRERFERQRLLMER